MPSRLLFSSVALTSDATRISFSASQRFQKPRNKFFELQEAAYLKKYSAPLLARSLVDGLFCGLQINMD